MSGRIDLIGIGPGNRESMTGKALEAIRQADVIVGYPLYIQLIEDLTYGKELYTTPMRKELARCEIAFEQALEGRNVTLICSGDAGIYGLASLMLTLSERYPSVELSVIPGVTAASAGAACLGAPLNNDFCTISLSDYLTPWRKIERRLLLAAEADFVIVIYNPMSKMRPDSLYRACRILRRCIEPERPCGYVKDIGRAGERVGLLTLEELAEAKLDMTTTVYVGAGGTRRIGDRLVTDRGYRFE